MCSLFPLTKEMLVFKKPWSSSYSILPFTLPNNLLCLCGEYEANCFLIFQCLFKDQIQVRVYQPSSLGQEGNQSYQSPRGWIYIHTLTVDDWARNQRKVISPTRMDKYTVRIHTSFFQPDSGHTTLSVWDVSIPPPPLTYSPLAVEFEGCVCVVQQGAVVEIWKESSELQE